MKQDAENSSTFRHSQFVKFLENGKSRFYVTFYVPGVPTSFSKKYIIVTKGEKNRENLFTFQKSSGNPPWI